MRNNRDACSHVTVQLSACVPRLISVLAHVNTVIGRWQCNNERFLLLNLQETPIMNCEMMKVLFPDNFTWKETYRAYF